MDERGKKGRRKISNTKLAPLKFIFVIKSSISVVMDSYKQTCHFDLTQNLNECEITEKKKSE